MSFNEEVAAYLAKLDRRLRRLELIENIESGSISASGAPIGAQYVTLAANATLTNERVLKAGSGIALTDNGTGTYVWVDFRAGSGLQYSASTLELAPHNHTSTNVTDFGEAARDTIGTALTNSATVQWQVSDAGDTISACVVGGSGSSASTQLLVEPFLRLPGLTGFWPMSGGYIDNTGFIAFNLSGYSDYYLSPTGCPQLNYDPYSVGYIPYAKFDSAYQGLRTAETMFVSKSNMSTAYPGLTMGGWFYSTAASPDRYLPVMGRWDTGSSNAGYRIVCACDYWGAQISTGGTTVTASIAGASVVPNTYTFVAMRYTPSGSLTIWTDDAKATNESGIPASINDATETRFAIAVEGEAASASSYCFQGRASFCFLSAMSLSDIFIETLYETTKWAFVEVLP